MITYHQCGKTIYHLSSISFDIINGSHLTFLPTALVKGRVAGIEIFGVQIILSYAHSVGEAVNMKYCCPNLTLYQQFYSIL